MPWIIVLLVLITGCRTLGSLNFAPGPIIITGNEENRSSYTHRNSSQFIDNYNSHVTEVSKNYDVSNCQKRGEIAHPIDGSVTPHKEVLLEMARSSGADTIQFVSHSEKELKAKLFTCNLLVRTPQENSSKYKFKKKGASRTDLDLFAGRYISRQGILKELGKMGPTFGIAVTAYPKKNHGYFFLWTFDHFWDTNSTLLKPKFFDENYTNYMLGGGYAFRWKFASRWQVNYKGGLAFNFIEIDTFGPGDAQKDQEYSDVTFSTIHKVGIDFTLQKDNPIEDITGKRIGLSLLYYFCPNPLGKFSNDDDDEQTGGSLAWSLELKWEI